MFSHLLHRRCGYRLPVLDKQVCKYSRGGVAGRSWTILLLAACGLFLVASRPCEAGCRGYIQFRVLHGISTAGLPLAEPGVAVSRQETRVSRVLPAPEMPCHGPECHAPPAQSSWPLVPLANGLPPPSLEATLSYASTLAVPIRVRGILALTSDRVARQAVDRLERPPRG